MNKKALTAGVLVSIMISIVFLLIVVGTIKNIDTNRSDQEKEVRCKTSIDNRARTAISINDDNDWDVVKGSIKGSPVLCETIKKKLKGDKESTLRTISEKMARCWWMFGEGNYEEILHESDPSFLFHGSETENSCFDCYQFMIDKPGIDISSLDLFNYMFNQKMLHGNVTYLDYIQSVGGPGRVVFLSPEGIKSDNVYTVSFAAKNKDDASFWRGALKITGAIAGAIILGPVIGVGVGLAVLGTIALGATGVSGVREIKATYLSNRDVSTIYFTHLSTGESLCDEGVVG